METLQSFLTHLVSHFPPLLTVSFLVGAAFLAGFIDAIVGGGGLITVPALMTGLPVDPKGIHGYFPSTLLGTNKILALGGTTMAAWKFLKTDYVDKKLLWLPMLCSATGAVGGFLLLKYMQNLRPDFLPKLMVGVMIGLLIFTLARPRLGNVHAPRFSAAHQQFFASMIGFVLGFYDGFFGPGTGSLLIFAFVTILGFDFLRASAMAKFVNWASNFCSVLLFIGSGDYLIHLAILLTICNAIGGILGARFATRRGTRWIKWLFVFVVSVLILHMTLPMFGVKFPWSK